MYLHSNQFMKKLAKVGDKGFPIAIPSIWSMARPKNWKCDSFVAFFSIFRNWLAVNPWKSLIFSKIISHIMSMVSSSGILVNNDSTSKLTTYRPHELSVDNLFIKSKVSFSIYLLIQVGAWSNYQGTYNYRSQTVTFLMNFRQTVNNTWPRSGGSDFI